MAVEAQNLEPLATRITHGVGHEFDARDIALPVGGGMLGIKGLGFFLPFGGEYVFQAGTHQVRHVLGKIEHFQTGFNIIRGLLLRVLGA